jgi:hypothetical protein
VYTFGEVQRRLRGVVYEPTEQEPADD